MIMKVISLVNGSLSSHTTAVYAVHYAKQLQYDLVLVYIGSSTDNKNLEQSVEDIKNLSLSLAINVEFINFSFIGELKTYVSVKGVDMIFCSVKYNKTIYDRSFFTAILRNDIQADFSLVKVVKIARAHSVEKIIMPARGSQVSVKKFSLFTTLSKSYDAKAEIYSVDKISKIDFSKKTAEIIKQRLQEIIFDLRHYLRLGKMNDFRFAIRHDYAFVEGDKIQEHIAHHRYDLIVVGGHHKKSLFFRHPIDVLFEKPSCNTIYFIPYKEQY